MDTGGRGPERVVVGPERGRGGLAAWALEPGLKCTHRWGRAIQASPPPSHDLVGCGDLGAGWLPKVMALSVPGFVCSKERWWGGE